MRYLFFLFFCFLINYSRAQTGSIQIIDHAGANALVDRHIYFNKQHSELPGWRIQIFASPSMTEAKNSKAEFLQKYDEKSATIVFEAPDYKVRIGNFLNRFDANRDFQEVIINYPNAFICKDLVNISDHE